VIVVVFPCANRRGNRFNLKATSRLIVRGLFNLNAEQYTDHREFAEV
jgi:hypothetical protein